MRRIYKFALVVSILLSGWLPGTTTENTSISQGNQQNISPTITPLSTQTPDPTNSISRSISIKSTLEPINARNIARLVNTDRWGYGPIRALAFSADGSFFLVASSYGLALYTMDKINEPPHWLSFDKPIDGINEIKISLDGKRALLLRGGDLSGFVTIDLSTGEEFDQMPSDQWTEVRNTISSGYANLSIISPDMKLLFQSQLTQIEYTDGVNIDITRQSEEQTIEEVYDYLENKKLFSLGMETQYLYYEDRSEPEGCDLDVFSPCGNALMALAWSPYRAAFSDNNKLLGVLYSPAYMGPSLKYRIFRVFDMSDGKLLYTIGGLKQPVWDFAFQPGSKQLLVGFADGSLQLWNSLGSSILWQSKKFSQPATKFAITNDEKFVLYQGILGDLEVRRTDDGKILNTYKSSAFSLAPIHNYLALGSEKGDIQVEDLDKLKTISRMTGHNKKILALAFSPDERTLVSSSQDCSIRSWDLRSGEYQHPYENLSVDPYELNRKSRVFIHNLVLVPETESMFGFGSWGTALNWTESSGKLNYFVQSEALGYYNGMTTVKPHFPNGFDINTATSSFSINDKHYDLKTGQEINKEFGDQQKREKSPEIDCFSNGPISKDKKIQFSIGYGDLKNQICVEDFESKKLLSTASIFSDKDNQPAELGPPILSPDGTTLYIPSSDEVTYIYQITD